MPLISLSFLLGCCWILIFSQLPNIFLLSLLLGAVLFCCLKWRRAATCALLFFLLGLTWVTVVSYHHLKHRLPKNLEGKSLIVKGTIISLPQITDIHQSFIFRTEKYKLKLNWYECKKILRAGDQWQLTVRLKRPRGFMNPGSFDYEGWLFQQNIGAVGYVVNRHNRLLSSHWHTSPITRLREKLQQFILQRFYGDSLVGFLPALIIGSRDQITEQQWNILRHTGTNHLIAIAGLHIGLIAGFIFFLVNFMWRRLGNLSLHIPAQQAAAFFSVIGGFVYALLAGMPIQTQRAITMLIVLLGTILLKRTLNAWHSWSLALFIVLILNPLNVMTIGFWMSFSAVAAIIYGMRGYLRPSNIWWKWGRVQWVIMIGVLPLSLLMFGEASLIGFIANMIAVPWFAFLIVPVCFSAAIIMLISKQLSYWLLWFALKNLHILWILLTKLSQLPVSIWHPLYLSPVSIVFLGIAVFLILSPKGFPRRYLSAVFLLPIIFNQGPTPKQSHAWFTLFDVGQGLASIVQTQHHVLIYDTGPKFSDHFNAGQAVILPYLQHQGIKKINLLMVSHGDTDHIGGANALIENDHIEKVLSSVPQRFNNVSADYCHIGQEWQWDGVNFKVVWPPIDDYDEDNNSSCVLRVSAGNRSILLTGDIQKSAEKKLVINGLKPVTILSAPHHGSKTSSSLAFIEATNPSYVLYGVGYRNRFHFPNRATVARYKQINAKQYDTARDGAIAFKLNGQRLMPDLYRLSHHHIWNTTQTRFPGISP